jgi:type IV pilus assembly protein PilX
MLTRHTPNTQGAMKPRQQGVVLMMALIVLVVLTLAALALTRSVYTSNVIAGNLAFQQAATHSADAGVEAAITWLENNHATASTAATCNKGSTLVACTQAASGYVARRQDPVAGQTWSDFWTNNLAANGFTLAMPVDGAGNTVSYVIQRMCSAEGDSQAVGNDCSVSPTASASTCSGGSSCDAQKVNLNSVGQVYYRITVRVDGPRNTQSFVQSMVAI